MNEVYRTRRQWFIRDFMTQTQRPVSELATFLEAFDSCDISAVTEQPESLPEEPEKPAKPKRKPKAEPVVESPQEAMEIAKKWTDEVDDSEFEDSEVEVDECDSYPDEANEDYMETIYTQDEAIDVDEYIGRYEAQDPEEVARGGWDMTNQLELNMEG